MAHGLPTAADFLDCYIQGPRGLTLDSLPGLGTGERTLGRESKLGESRFYLLAVCCAVLGKTLAGLCASFSPCTSASLTYLLRRCNGTTRTVAPSARRTGLGPGPVLSTLHTPSCASLHSVRQQLLSPRNLLVCWPGSPEPSLPWVLPHRAAGRTELGPAGLSMAVALRRQPWGGGLGADKQPGLPSVQAWLCVSLPKQLGEGAVISLGLCSV